MTTTIKELAKTTNIATSELAAKAGELGFKGGTNAPLPEDIEKQLVNTKPANNGNGNGNGKHELALSSEHKTIDLSNPNLEEELKVAAAIGIAKADLLLEAQRQAFEQRYGEGEEEMADYVLGLYSEYQEALGNLQAARQPRKRQSISEKFAELQAQIAKK